MKLTVHQSNHFTKTGLSILVILFLFSFSFFFSCTKNPVRDYHEEITFAVTGNTAPESPFVGFTEVLPQLYEAINKENPLMLIHTGNFIHGGYPWMGIKEMDLKRQFDHFRKSTKILKPILYNTAGTSDLYNNDPSLYMKFTQRELNYSFNYGSIHFIVLNTVETQDKKFSLERSIAWLQQDLKRYRSSSAVLVFTHHELFAPPRGKSSHEYAETIHNILKHYRVIAVVSGHEPQFFTVTKDNIQYINAGCSGFTYKERPYRSKQYYIITYQDKEITVIARRIHFIPDK